MVKPNCIKFVKLKASFKFKANSFATPKVTENALPSFLASIKFFLVFSIASEIPKAGNPAFCKALSNPLAN